MLKNSECLFKLKNCFFVLMYLKELIYSLQFQNSVSLGRKFFYYPFTKEKKDVEKLCKKTSFETFIENDTF